jgi:hypothetical protein
MTDTTTDRFVVEQAKGVIMLRYGVSSYESLAALARWGREAHVPLPELAHALVKGVCQGRVMPESRGLVRWLEHRLRADIGEPAAPLPAPPPAPTPPLARRSGSASAPPSAPAPRGHGTLAVESPAGAGAGRGPRQWRYSSAVHAARVRGSS